MLFFAMIMTLAAPAEAMPTEVAPPAKAEERREPMIPATNPGSWVTNGDYPAAAMRDEREGTTGFRLTVTPDGLPRRCDVTASSGHADLDTTTCRLLMERARFKPGRDKTNMRVGGTYSSRIRWQIPDDYIEQLATAGFNVDESLESWPRGPSPRPATLVIDLAPHYPAAARAARQEGEVRMRVNVDPLGKVTGCNVTEGSQSAALDEAACALMRSQGEFEPALDSAGTPTKGVVPAVFRWILPREDSAEDTVKPPRALRKFPMTEPGSAMMSVLVDAEGKANDCSFSDTGELSRMAAGANPCDMLGGEQRYIPFVDAKGNPVGKRITFRTELKIEDAAAVKPAAPQ